MDDIQLNVFNKYLLNKRRERQQYSFIHIFFFRIYLFIFGFYSHISEGWKSRHQRNQCLVRASSLFTDSVYHVLHGGRDKGAPWSPFIRAIIPFVRALPSWPTHITKVPTSNTITIGIRFQLWILRWHKHWNQSIILHSIQYNQWHRIALLKT